MGPRWGPASECLGVNQKHNTTQTKTKDKATRNKKQATSNKEGIGGAPGEVTEEGEGGCHGERGIVGGELYCSASSTPE